MALPSPFCQLAGHQGLSGAKAFARNSHPLTQLAHSLFLALSLSLSHSRTAFFMNKNSSSNNNNNCNNCNNGGDKETMK